MSNVSTESGPQYLSQIQRNVDSVEYTISQDRGAGDSAQTESDYNLLIARDDGLVHGPSSASGTGSNHALQDYQMQLMLLEQLNTKRLLAARQLQDMEENTSNNRFKYSGTGEAASSAVQRVENAATSSGLPDDLEYHVFYRVFCANKHPKCHRRIYMDQPRRISVNGTYHLCGTQLVFDLDDLIAGLPSVAFIVYRDCICSSRTQSLILSNLTKPGTKFFQELISVVAEELHSAMQRNSMFAPDHQAYKLPTLESREYESSAALSTAPSEYSHRWLYHHREILRTEAVAAVAGSPIKALVSYITLHPDPLYRKCDELFARGMVTLDTLPWLFAPNTIVVSSQSSWLEAYILRRVPIEEGSTLRLACWNWGYDGHWFRRKDTTLSVNAPSYGEMRINQLAVYPLKYSTIEVYDNILASGKRFLNLTRQILASYEGPDYQGERIYPSDSRFMIDYQTYAKFHRSAGAFNFSRDSKADFDPWLETLSCDASLSDEHLLLLPLGIHGFYFKEKKWMHLLVEKIQPVNWNKTAFEQLVLPKRTKNLIKALVMVRKQTLDGSDLQIGLKGERDDIIAGKGSGLIMLLHGGPGTGKTLTAGKAHGYRTFEYSLTNPVAERYYSCNILPVHTNYFANLLSVAELAEMPLYSVTCGDIGTNPEAVEKYLNAVLHLGKKWNCGMLPSVRHYPMVTSHLYLQLSILIKWL
ncbi:hypothetical protein QBC35DRAFT_396715 [Podospora australis]|uniref:DUF7025 domain-containing protein n=1 Tax=Podospora australis TaxID=1536484 RepID=A0AAN7AB31_9PEZI|nr:hypothetical protein QBC35DRAFT_396715 [Podospora australis]